MQGIAIDEKTLGKGPNYTTLIDDLDRSTVEAISGGIDTASENACFSLLSPQQRESVEAIAMNMSAAIVKSAKQHISLAKTKIVHNRFHAMKLVGESGGKVRRGEHRPLKQEGDGRLIGTRYLWLTNQENLTEDQKARFGLVYKQELEAGKAWACILIASRPSIPLRRRNRNRVFP
ncbi:transposase [Crateriforma spongiae]|uniref:transposase n=1 Tax=Crateriforma spongiae TaxID=2724528 RepID=UPI00197CE8DF|nr:transposase [Crateriforma spongiae]